METVKERLIKFINHLGIGQSKFEKITGLSNGYVNNIRKSISPEYIEKIRTAYPLLNRDWLMFGEGDMLNEKVIPDTNENTDLQVNYAVVKMLSDEVSVLKAKNEGISKEDAIKAMKKKTNSIYRDTFL